MLPLRFIRENADLVRAGLTARADDAPLDELLELDRKRRAFLVEVEQWRAERKRVSRAIGAASDAGERETLIAQTRALSSDLDEAEPKLGQIEAEIDGLLAQFPALPHASVPAGRDAADNPLVASRGAPRSFDFDPRPHWEIGESLGVLDFPRAAKIAGSGFWLFRAGGARLQRALVAWAIDFQVREHGYLEVLPPALVTSQGMTDSGKLPKFADDSYEVSGDGLWLNPTAEVPLTAMHRDEVLDGGRLPLRYVAYTPAFRREAGAAGIDTRGLQRLHQFDKVELYSFSLPEHSYDELEVMRRHAEAALEALGLPYRTLELCTGDLGFTSAKTYDLEAWAPGVNAWLEVSSISNCEAFQARRAGLRARKPGGSQTEYVHTLNGSGLGMARTMVGILENGQQADGTVRVPEVLQPYLDGQTVLEVEPGWQ